MLTPSRSMSMAGRSAEACSSIQKSPPSSRGHAHLPQSTMGAPASSGLVTAPSALKNLL